MLSSLLALTCVCVITIINADRTPVKCVGTWSFTAIVLLPSIIPVVTVYLHMHPFPRGLKSRDHIFPVSFSSVLNIWTNKTQWILKDELNLVSCRLSNYQEQDRLHGAMSSNCLVESFFANLTILVSHLWKTEKINEKTNEAVLYLQNTISVKHLEFTSLIVSTW